mgnify:CR=1 FL=1
MRKLILLLLFPAFLFAQDFRKMSFGQSIEELKETYPTIEFTVENEAGTLFLAHADLVAGLESTVAYAFVENKFSAGYYTFRTDIFKSAEEITKDYKSVSSILNDKYEMVENNTWHDDSYKDDPETALYYRLVDFSEQYVTDKVIIAHSLSKSGPFYTHMVGYFSPSMVEFVNAKNDSDF